MSKEVSFCTALFENKTVQPHFINDPCFGEDLAKWVVENLTGNEFSWSEPYQEDRGWEIEAKREDELFFIRIGIMDESIG